MTRSLTTLPAVALALSAFLPLVAAAENKTKKRDIWISHMAFMIAAWLVLFPLGIIIARFGRTKFKWFPAHTAFQVMGLVIFIVGFFLAVGGIAYEGGTHFQGTHEKLGLALFIITWFQCALGSIQHMVYIRTGFRIPGYVHVIFGLALFGLSVWEIILGFGLIQKDITVPSYVDKIIYGWMGFLVLVYIIGMLFLPKQWRAHKEHQRNVRSNKSGDAEKGSFGDDVALAGAGGTAASVDNHHHYGNHSDTHSTPT